MTFRKIAWFPIAWGALFLVVAACFPADGRKPIFLLGNEASKALAAVGCFVAAYAFERGEYMRRTWTFNAWCYLLLLIRDLLVNTFAPDAQLGGLSFSAIEGTLALLANASSVLGVWRLARAWSIAGMELPGSRAARFAVIGVAGAIALGISGSDLWVDGRSLLEGNLGSLHGVASDLGDVLSLALIAPVMLTTVAMRGGALKWPWALLTASLLFWLLYDAASTIDHFVPGHETATRLARETFRALACATEFSAGLAQRRVVTASELEPE